LLGTGLKKRGKIEMLNPIGEGYEIFERLW